MKMQNFYKVYFAVFIAVFPLGSCLNTDGATGYDQHFNDLVRSGVNGDVAAAQKAYDYCTAYLKLDEDGLLSPYLGRCGGVVAIWKDDALQSGDPRSIRDVFAVFERAPPDYKNHLPKLYMKEARSAVEQRCAQDSPPLGCKDDVLLRWFGLSISVSNAAKSSVSPYPN